MLVLSKAAWASVATVTLSIKNMNWATCLFTVRKAINMVPGVRTVGVDYRDGIAVIAFDDAIATVDKLIAASRGVGFPAARKE